MKRAVFFLLMIMATYPPLFCQTNIPLRYQVCDNCSPQEGGDDLTETYTYQAIEEYESVDVTSDFGARSLNGYDWHKGVDYRPLQYAGALDLGRGTAIIAAESGAVTLIYANGGYKYIVIDSDDAQSDHGFGYGHIFNSRDPDDDAYLQSGAFVLKRMESPDEDHFAIINLNTNTAISDAEDGGTVTLGGVGSFQCSSSVTTNAQAIAPMGGASDANEGGYHSDDGFPCHLHLYYFDDVNATPLKSSNNCKDPLQVIDHDEPVYNIKFHTKGLDFGEVAIHYPGYQPTKFRVRAVMEGAQDKYGNDLGETGSSSRYGNVVLDVNDVQLLIKKESGSIYHLIEGAEFSSKISHGGTWNTIPYPAYIVQDNMHGSWDKQGIAPFAYSDNNGHPYDDYYLIDFITRIDKDSPVPPVIGNTVNPAYCPENARYSDGIYSIRARVTDVNGGVPHQGPLNENGAIDPIEFILDNFKPYINQVDIKIGNSLVYQGKWDCKESPACNGSANTGSIKFIPTEINPPYFPPPIPDYYDIAVVNVVAHSSEPLEWLTVTIPEFNNADYSDMQMTPNDERTIWSLTFANSPLVGGVDLHFVFDGRDYSHAPEDGNRLLNLDDHTGEDCTRIPIRSGSNENSWIDHDNIPQGDDFTHVLEALPCGFSGDFTLQGAYKSLLLGNDCLLVDFDFQFNPATCAFDFTDLSEGSISTWFWDFDDGAVSNLQHPTHAFPATGCYDVTLTITNEDGVSSSITKEVCYEGKEYPYVKEVSMYADDGTGSTLIYHGVWEDMGDCIFFEKETYPYNLSAMATASVTVEVVTSKPFSDLIMALSGTIIELAGSDENWTGLIPAGFFEEQVLSNGSIYQPIFFQGQDMEGNPLMELNSMSTSMVQCVTVPEWTAACTWEPAPVISPNGDQVHVLEMHCEWVDFSLDVGGGTISLVYNETPIKVRWTGPGITPQNMYNFVVENAEFGQYCATVLFANGCALNKCVIFPGQMLLIPEYTSPCPGMSDGSICVNVYGGSGSYALTWQSGSTGNCLTGLEPGDGDCLTVVDLVYGEVVQECYDVPVFAPPMIELASLDPPCPDGTGGQICVNVSGSNPPFMVEWPGSGAAGLCNETLQDGELICAVVTDGCGVEVEECFPAPAYSGMQVSNLEVVHPIENCPSGMISFDIAGGIPPYAISWTRLLPFGLGQTVITTEPELNNLSPGNYEVFVTDACGQSTIPFVVQLVGAPQPYYLFLSINPADITHVCSEEDDSGSIDLNVFTPNDGVLGDITYQWSNGATTQDISNLLPGTYSVTVTDPNTGCSYTASATVESKAIDPAWFYYSFILPSCANEATGSIFLNPISKYGQGTFSFLWSNGETGRYPQHLPAGTNTVTITNQYGCYTEMTFEVGEVASPEIMLTELQHAYTEGESNGKISVTAKGSNPPFTYQWSNGGVGSTIGDLPVGTYTVTVSNSMGCSSQATFKIDYCIVVYAPGLTWENFTYIQHSREVTPQSAPGASDGAIDVTITQGSAPIYYYWTGPGGFESDAQDISGLEEGKYCATITNGCDEVNFCEWVVNCDDFEVELIVTQNGSQEGICWTPCSSPIIVTATVSNYHGALGMMQYEWEFIGEENPLVGNSSKRTFSWDNLNAVNWANLKITVTDEAGCIRSTTINLFDFAEFPSSENNFVLNYLTPNQQGEADALQYFLTAAVGYEGCGSNLM